MCAYTRRERARDQFRACCIGPPTKLVLWTKWRPAARTIYIRARAGLTAAAAAAVFSFYPRAPRESVIRNHKNPLFDVAVSVFIIRSVFLLGFYTYIYTCIFILTKGGVHVYK